MKNLTKTLLLIIMLSLIGIISVIALVIWLTTPSNQSLTTPSNQPPKPQLYTAIGPIVTIISIATTVIFYFKKQEDEKNAVKMRTILALTEEINENKNILRSKKFRKVVYPIANTRNLQYSIPDSEVRYTDAYLDLEVYQSILQTEFTFLSPKTQRRLSLLYSRIRSRNELLSYTDHFQDLFFTLNEESESSYCRWYKSVERYDITLTIWEQEIARLLDEVENSIISERPKK